MERASTSDRTPSAMIITTCAASPGGLPADARNFSFPMKRDFSPRTRPTKEEKKNKSDVVPRNERGLKSTKARTAGGKKLNPQVQASAEHQALEGLKQRTEEGHLQAGRPPAS